MLIDQLREARQSLGWSQRALAERLAINTQVIKRLEAGVGSVSTLIDVMTALDFRLSGVGPGKSLCAQLSAARHKRALSLAAVSQQTGLSRTTIISLERGGGSVASLLRLMAVVAPRARRRAQERAWWGQGDKEDRDSRFTPAAFMAGIYDAFGPVDLDPCANLLSPVVAKRRILLAEGGDGLIDDWSGRLAFVNPPFSETLTWLRRAHDQWRAGNVETVVCLVPLRTDSAWFHETLCRDADMFLLQGRVRFLDSSCKGQHTPFALMVLTLGATNEQKRRYSHAVKGFWVVPADRARSTAPAAATSPLALEAPAIPLGTRVWHPDYPLGKTISNPVFRAGPGVTSAEERWWVRVEWDSVHGVMDMPVDLLTMVTRENILSLRLRS